MGQYWKFFNLTSTRMQYAEANGLLKLGCIFHAKQPFLVRSLAMPYPVPELAKYLANAPPAGPIAKKGLLSLPDELLDALFWHEDLPVRDCICLAITCKKLLAIAEGSLLVHCRDLGSASWASCKIACIGDYLNLDDAPERLIPATLKAQMRQTLAAKGHDIDEMSYGGLLEFCTTDGTRRLYRGVYQQHADFLETLPLPDRHLFVAAAAVTFPPRDDWALLNLDKFEYVRAGPLAALGGCPDDEQPFLEHSPVDLGMALLTRFAFSSSSDISMPNESVRLHRGKWVGDRFSIETLEKAIAGENAHKWKDVTDEVVADIVTIYKDQFGEQWEKELQSHQGPYSWSFYSWDTPSRLEYLLPSPEEEEKWRKRRERYAVGAYSDTE